MQEYILSLVTKATKEKPISRAQIMELTRLTDRAVRNVIGKLRDKGNRVANTPDQKGYWVTKSESEYQEFRNFYVSAPKTVNRRARAMDNHCEGQEVMNVL